MREPERVVDEFLRHITDFVEKSRAELGGLPVCPFARNARKEGRLRFEVCGLTKDGIMKMIPSFLEEIEKEALICIDPRKDLPCAEVYRLADELNVLLPAHGLQAFCGHPEDPFNVGGLYTRREPYPNVQIIRQSVVVAAHESIRDSDYYELWTKDNYRHTDIIEPPNLSGY